jgi:hypothetical protein
MVEMKFDTAIVVGAGGTGSHLMEPLVRLLSYHENGTTNFTLVDGDVYEARNGERQLFNADALNRNKAEALAERLSFANIAAIPRFINGEMFRNLVDSLLENDINKSLLAVMAVDNHATRKDLIEALDESPYRNWVLFSPGNSYSIGQVIIHARRNGKQLTYRHPFDKYPLLKDPEDHIPGFGCHEEAVSSPQLLVSNASAALAVAYSVSAMLDGRPWYEEVHFDIERLKIAPQGAPIEVPILEESRIVIKGAKKKATKKKTAKKKTAKKKTAKKKTAKKTTKKKTAKKAKVKT